MWSLKVPSNPNYSKSLEIQLLYLYQYPSPCLTPVLISVIVRSKWAHGKKNHGPVFLLFSFSMSKVGLLVTLCKSGIFAHDFSGRGLFLSPAPSEPSPTPWCLKLDDHHSDLIILFQPSWCEGPAVSAEYRLSLATRSQLQLTAWGWVVACWDWEQSVTKTKRK